MWKLMISPQHLLILFSSQHNVYFSAVMANFLSWDKVNTNITQVCYYRQKNTAFALIYRFLYFQWRTQFGPKLTLNLSVCVRVLYTTISLYKYIISVLNLNLRHLWQNMTKVVYESIVVIFTSSIIFACTLSSVLLILLWPHQEIFGVDTRLIIAVIISLNIIDFPYK